MTSPAVPTTVRPAALAQRIGCAEPDETLCEAFEFVSLCNRHTTPNLIVFDDPETGERRMEVSRNELHFKQESAFRRACEYIGMHFAKAARKLHREDHG